MSEQEKFDGRRDADVHGWFGLTYANYLVLPRSLMQAMPIEWQKRMVACLDDMRAATAHLKVHDDYTVLLRGERGRIMKDPYAEYRHSKIGPLEVRP